MRPAVLLLALTLVSCAETKPANPRPTSVTPADVSCHQTQAARMQADTLMREGRAERALRKIAAADAACPAKASASWAARVTALASLRRDNEARTLVSAITNSVEAPPEAKEAAAAARNVLATPAGTGNAALAAAEGASSRGDEVEARRQFERAAVLMEGELHASMKLELVSPHETQLAGSHGWSSDGSLYVMALGSTMVAYDTSTWRERFAVSFPDEIADLLISSSMPVAIVAMREGPASINIVDLTTGGIRPFPADRDVRPLLSPDGRKVMLAPPGGQSVSILGLDDMAVATIPEPEPYAFQGAFIEWSQDGRFLLARGLAPMSVYEVSSRKRIATLADALPWADGVSWKLTEDGHYLAWARAKGNVLTPQIFDLNERKALGALTAPGCKGGSVNAVSHRNGIAATSLVTTTGTTKLCFWQIATQKLLSVAEVPSLASLAFTPDEAAVVIGTREPRVRLAKVSGGGLSDFVGNPEELAGLFGPSHLINGSTYIDLRKQTRISLEAATDRYEKAKPSPDGRFVAARGSSAVRVWEIPSGKSVFKSPAVLASVAGLALHPEPIVVAGREEVVRWDFQDGKGVVLNAPAKSQTDLQALAMTTAGETLMIRSTAMRPNTETRLYQASRGSEGRPLRSSDMTIFEAPRLKSATSAHGDVLALSDGRSIRVWDVAGAGEKLSFTQPQEVTALSMSADGGRIATGSSVGVVRMFDATNGKLICATPEIERSPSDRAIVFGARGETVLSQTADEVALWNATTCAQIAKWTPSRGSGGLSEMDSPMGLVLADGGDRVAVIDARHVRLLDARSLRVIRTIETAMWAAEAVAVGADGRIVLGGSRGLTEVYRGSDGMRVLSVALPEHTGGGVAVAADGRYALMGDIPSARAQVACRIGPRSVPLAVCAGRLEELTLASLTVE